MPYLKLELHSDAANKLMLVMLKEIYECTVEDDPKVRKAAKRLMMYHMKPSEILEYFGPKATEKYYKG
jgi:hypothetical protein